jgi:phospholipid/cholesterol/gamma-HCH transport system substrate-binding protein
MASPRTKFTVGLFIAGGMGIALLAFIWLGMSHFLEKGRFYVTYFDESVQGLDKDSSVKYRGVSIGRVERIGVAPDSKLIEVVLKIESGQELDSSIVAQLKSVGITGSMFVELDRKRKGEPDRSPPLNFPAEYPIVSSKPSSISELLRGIDDIMNQLRALDLEGISKQIKLTIGHVNQVITDANVKGLSEKIQLSLENVNKTITDANVKGISKNIESSVESIARILDNRRWDNIMASAESASQSLNALLNKADSSLNRVEGIVTEKEESIKTAIEGFREAIKNANIFLEKGTLLASDTNHSFYQLQRHLLVVAQNLAQASENLNRLIELLADQPSQLIFGEPPLPRKVEPLNHEK